MIKEDVSITQKDIDSYRSVFDNSKEKPAIECQLFEAQNDWLLDRDNAKKKAKFVYILDGYARSAVLNLLKDSEGVAEWEVDQIISDTCRRVIKLYTRSHEYVIGTSFWPILLFKAKEALSLFRHNKKNNSVSIDAVISNDPKKPLTLMDLLAKNSAIANSFDVYKDTPQEIFAQKLQAGFDYIYENSDCNDLIDVYKVLFYSYERIVNISLKTKQKMDSSKAFCIMNKVLKQAIDSSPQNYVKYRRVEKLIVGFLKAIRR